MSDTPSVKKLKGGRTECTVTFTPEQVQPAEEKALHELSREVEAPGFRKGNVPLDVAKEKINPQQLFEGTVHHLLPTTFEQLIKEHDLKPIARPLVEAVSREPLTLKVTFLEKPPVNVKAVGKIKIERKEPKVDETDVQKMIEYVLDKHKTVAVSSEPAKESDQITMDFWGEDSAGTEIEGIRTTGHQVIIGSKTLIPGFEDQLVGLKPEDSKDFTLTFPDKYHAEALQGQPVIFHVKVTKVETVAIPELTDEFAKAQLQAKDKADFVTQIRESMVVQEQTIERQRQERLLLDEIANVTEVELAPELVDEETKQVIDEFAQQLGQQGMQLEQWLEASQKKPEDFITEMKQQAEKRLIIRLAMAELVEQHSIEVSDDEMKPIVEEFLHHATPEQRAEVAEAYAPGQNAYEQLRWQTKVERLLEKLLA